jgi:hypothetical protein
MKQYVVDELRPLDYKLIKSHLNEKLGDSFMGGLYKLPIDPEILTDAQRHHTQCQPYYFAIDLEPDRMAFELLVRSDQKIRCNCIGYATEKQRNWLIQLADIMFDQLKIIL